MIVKLIIHRDLDGISIWNQEGDRLWYSDKHVDIEEAKKLLSVIKKPSDKELAQAIVEKRATVPVYEQKMAGYFNAYWKNKIIQLVKRAEGYSW